MQVATLPAPEAARIAVIGLDYVRLPLAVEFAKSRPVLGFDIAPDRLQDLRAGKDHTREVSPGELRLASGLVLTGDPQDLKGCNT